MKSEKILVDGKEFYINAEGMKDPSIKKLFLYEDPDLSKLAKGFSGMTKMVNKDEIEEILKENIGGAGGAGYAVWGGGWGRSFGNPSMGGKFTGRGFGFGGSQNLGGGPNLMYTYSVVPLNQKLQAPGTPQGDDRYIHVGSEVKGKILDKEEEIEGKIISSKEDEDGNILYHIVQDLETAEKHKVDPTSIELITHEERPEASMMDYVGAVGEEFYPSFKSFLNESEFERGQDPKRALGIGTFPSLIEEYEFLIKKYPELDISNFYKVRGFQADEENKREIYSGFYRRHPMSGYGGGRDQYLGFWGKIKWMPSKKVYRAKFTEQDSGYNSWKGDFETLEEALRFGIPKFEGLLSYYPELKK